MSKNELNTFTDHMELIGYEFEEMPDEPDTLLGKHDKYGPTLVVYSEGIAYFRSFFSIGSKATKEQLQYLDMVNDLNKKSSISTYVGYDDRLLIIAVYAGTYDKKEFGNFLDTWHSDNYLLSEQEGIEDFVE